VQHGILGLKVSGFKFSGSKRNYNMQMETLHIHVRNAYVIIGIFLAFAMIWVGSISDLLVYRVDELT
jgi:hypothetical protein